MDAVVMVLDKINLQNYTKEQLFEEIAKIGGMSDVSHMKAYQALTGDVSAARAFLACPIDRLWYALEDLVCLPLVRCFKDPHTKRKAVFSLE
uniref:Uncharacterized protein n=1 Tax=Vitis vinifera TaxID=29760 RepID=A5AE99_VITVI|nr:hypothetical protein VITISV_008566 [Vitis vinifera]